MSQATKDFLGMSDDDFLQINPPEVEETQSEEPVDLAPEASESSAEGETQTEEETPSAYATSDDSDDELASEFSGDDAEANGDGGTLEASDDEESEDQKGPEADKKSDPSGSKPDGEADAKAENKPLDYENFYNQVMTPFKANGRMIELKTPDEAIRLMQMGAGYGRKIQDLQPHLKVLRMLEKNNLLSEEKLSFLIDVNQKNPDAIKKIVQDSGIDPLDINVEDNVDYVPKNHAVSDKEMAFQNALEEVQTLPTGQETLRIINQSWDQESKSLLWESPEIIGVIQTQRENGIYDQIVTEIDRQRLLGHIPPNAPFLQAYKLAGDHLQATNGFRISEGQVPPIQNQSGNNQQPQVIATRSAAPKSQVQHNDKAKAAAPTKSVSSRKSNGTVNPLAMADDDFLKQFQGRL